MPMKKANSFDWSDKMFPFAHAVVPTTYHLDWSEGWVQNFT
jgi:hypothetical protein